MNIKPNLKITNEEFQKMYDNETSWKLMRDICDNMMSLKFADHEEKTLLKKLRTNVSELSSFASKELNISFF